MFNKVQVAAGLPTQLNKTTPMEGAGFAIHQSKGLLKCVYDFATQGGAAGTISLVDDLGNSAILPQGATVTNVVAVVQIAALTGTTISLGLLTTTDLMAATATASLTLAAKIAGVPVGTAATWVGPVVSAAGTPVTATLVGAYTAGRIFYFVEYVIA